MGSLRSSSLASLAPAVLASPVFVLAAAPLSPAPHGTTPHASPASSAASASLRRLTPSRVLFAAAFGARSEARATPVSGETEGRTLDLEFYIKGRVNAPHTGRYSPTVLRFRTTRAKGLYRITINQWL